MGFGGITRAAPSLAPGRQKPVVRIWVPIVFAIAIAMRLHGLDGRFDYDGYDEGVYWQTLRAMAAGYGLYGAIFHSQPPAFLLSVYPFYRLFGATIVAARLGVVVLTLLGLAGAYLMGKALSGRWGGLAALVIAAVTPAYLEASQRLEAEGPATALLFLGVGGAFMWWAHPTGKRGLAFAILSGIALVLGVLTKLLDVTALVPIAMLGFDRLWQTRKRDLDIGAMLRPIAGAAIAAAAVALIVLTPVLGTPSGLLRQVVTFHLAARRMSNVSDFDNIGTLCGFLAANVPLCAAATFGAVVAVLRRDRRVVPLVAWLAATLVALVVQVPLFSRHAIVLIPPLVAMSVLALHEPPAGRPAWRMMRIPRRSVIGVLALAIILTGVASDYRYQVQLNAQASSSEARMGERIAADLQRATAPGQWVITDAQFISALADRDTPPWLADTSSVRIDSGYLDPSELTRAASDRRVHAVLFATGRLTSAAVSGFHAWVAQHYHLLRVYGPGIELWTRS